MTDAARKREFARGRYRRWSERKGAGVIRLVLFAESLWLAEVLNAAGGYASPDEDDHAKLREGAQAMLDYLIARAKAGGD